MNDWTTDDIVVLVLRVTLALLLGTIALKFTRDRRPSLAIVIARAMLVAVWVGPMLVLSGWTVGVAVLPAQPSPAPIAMDTQPIDSRLHKVPMDTVIKPVSIQPSQDSEQQLEYPHS